MFFELKLILLNEGSVLIFRGKDQNGRMVLLRLSNPQSIKNKDEKMKISLTLSYIEKPLQSCMCHRSIFLVPFIKNDFPINSPSQRFVAG
jgi:hypothetical protein